MRKSVLKERVAWIFANYNARNCFNGRFTAPRHVTSINWLERLRPMTIPKYYFDNTGSLDILEACIDEPIAHHQREDSSHVIYSWVTIVCLSVRRRAIDRGESDQMGLQIHRHQTGCDARVLLVFFRPMMSLALSNRNTSSRYDPLAQLVEVATALAQMPQTAAASASSMSKTRVIPPVTAQDSDYLSVVSNDEDESLKRSAASPVSIQGYSKREIFPQRLLAILNDSSLSDVVSWLPHGKSFVIIRPDVFTDKVLPKYLPPTDARSSTKYASFTRKLNRWYVLACVP